MLLTIETCTTALSAAAMNYKAAIQLELAVGLAVFHLHGGTNREARQMLVAAYEGTGWHCTKIEDPDYKTVNRRINATASLYEKVPVAKWVGQLEEMDVIHAICMGLEPYELYTMQDVLRYATPQKFERKVKVEPRHDILSGPVQPESTHTGQQDIMTMFRRASDQVGQGIAAVSTEHLSLVIPKDVSRKELIDFAMQLMALAKNNENELLTA
jgi:hypothetical protein